MKRALLGNCSYQALVDATGSVDWLCWPRFDSSPVFGALLDTDRGGFFSDSPVGEFTSEQDVHPQHQHRARDLHHAAWRVRSGRFCSALSPIRASFSPQPAFAPRAAIEWRASCAHPLSSDLRLRARHTRSSPPVKPPLLRDPWAAAAAHGRPWALSERGSSLRSRAQTPHLPGHGRRDRSHDDKHPGVARLRPKSTRRLPSAPCPVKSAIPDEPGLAIRVRSRSLPREPFGRRARERVA